MIFNDINILIADDHKMIRDGIRLMLSLQSNKINFLFLRLPMVAKLYLWPFAKISTSS